MCTLLFPLNFRRRKKKNTFDIVINTNNNEFNRNVLRRIDVIFI